MLTLGDERDRFVEASQRHAFGDPSLQLCRWCAVGLTTSTHGVRECNVVRSEVGKYSCAAAQQSFSSRVSRLAVALIDLLALLAICCFHSSQTSDSCQEGARVTQQMNGVVVGCAYNAQSE